VRPAPLALALVAAWAAAARADGTADPRPAPRRLYLRAGAAHVAPLESSREMELSEVDGPASLAISNGPIEGSGAAISSATVPALIVGYVLPWRGDRLSVETVLGLPFNVRFQVSGTLATESIAPTALGLPTGVGPLGPEFGEAKAAPIVVTAIYRLRSFGPLTPFAGGGAAVMFTFDERVTNPMLTEVGEPDFSVEPAPGLVLQGGLEARISERIFARLDVKFIALMLARAKVEHIEVRTPGLPLFDSVEVGTAKMSVWVNPVIVQAGLGADF
jgi:outer membrane protein W